MVSRKLVCLGGGIGTVNLIKGLKDYSSDITVVSSMADNGGSSGRLSRLYGVLPPGDIISCIAAIGNKDNPQVSNILTYRFPGDRYGSDDSLEGQKLGNLLLTAIYNETSDFTQAVKILQQMLGIKGKFLPATLHPVDISIKLKSGQIVTGEESIDLGKYEWKKEIEEVYLEPKDVKANPEVLSEIEKADCIVVGPGDLYSNEFPVLIVEGIADALKTSKAKKFLVINVANKPQETQGYSVSDYFSAFKKHIDGFPFDTVFVNNNHKVPIPPRYKYEYVKEFGDINVSGVEVLKLDLLDENFPLYHDSHKLAKAIVENI